MSKQPEWHEKLLTKMRFVSDIYRQAEILCDNIVKHTRSEYGFVDILSDGALHVVGLSGIGWEACQMPIQELVFPPSVIAGKNLYMIPIRTNKYYITNTPAKDPQRRGIPKGHPPLNSFLGVPLRIGRKPVGIICVANKSGGYNVKDAEDLMTLLKHLIPFVTQAQSEIASTKAKSMIQNARDGLILHNTQGQIFYANPAFYKQLGLSTRKVLTSPFTELVVAEDAQQLVENFQKAIKTRQAVSSHEIRFRGKQGKILYFSMKTAPTAKRKGNFLVSVASDITERKLAEDAVQEARAQAEFFNDLMAHDLSNINQGIMSWLDLLLELPNLPEQFRTIAKSAMSQVERSSQLIDNVRKIAEIESSSQQLREMDIFAALISAQQAVESTFPEREMHLKTNFSKGDYHVMADDFLHDLLFNILHNAMKFDTEQKVRVSVRVRQSSKDKYLKIEITDWGPGISDKEKEMIFTRFTRIGKSVTGSGIGLTLVKRILDRYGGKIRVGDRIRGNPAKGAKFVLHFQRGK